MLSKKQYWYTLVIAIIVFFVIFGIVYFFTIQTGWDVQQELNSPSSVAQEDLALSTMTRQIMISPQTKVTLKIEDGNKHQIEQVKLDTSSLMGFTEDTLRQQFSDYTIETFNEKEVTLVKKVESAGKKATDSKEHDYVLGVDGNYVCIKEKGTTNRPVKIDYEVNHFSKYVYSMLLNEEITITGKQKEALLLNPSTLQRILQGYVGE